MTHMRYSLIAPLLLAAALGACAAKAQVRNEIEVPLLDPPAPPPRVVVTYAEPEPPPEPPPVETAVPPKPVPRPPRAVQQPDPVETPPEPVVAATKPPSPGALTLTPTPGSEAQTVAAIRSLMERAQRDLQRVNAGALNHDGRAQLDQARRFLQQADEALKVRNIVFAGRLADKAATMAAILVR